MDTASLGDRVRIQYVRVPELIASTNRAPAQKACEFTVGSREVFRSLSVGVVGMAPGDRKQLTLQPQEAYGNVKPKLVREVPRSRFPQHIALRVGKRLTAFEAASGRRRRVRIVKIDLDSVLVDGNHPLAGKVVEIEVCLISIDSSSNANRRKPQFDMGGES
jgi:FKBP-type peptidyl-prolyl cis-trans isomerase 2